MRPLSFSLDEDSGQLRVRFDPAGGMPPPDLSLFRQTLAERGWSSLHLDEKLVEQFINLCRKTTEPVDAIVGERRDGEFAVIVDNDQLTAWLTLIPPRGGQPVTLAAVGDELVRLGIVHGILRGEIERAVAEGQCERLMIARGEPTREGAPTRFEVLFDKEEEPSDEDDLERVKYADLSHLLLVKVGDPLMRRVPPVPGVKGTDIMGHALLPQPTPDIPFRMNLDGAEPSKDDPDLLVATLGGQPTARADGVTVNPVLEVLNVDLGTGSIDFEGTLRVGGDVKAGLRIKVSGDVIVNGAMEAAEIIAGGNVAVRGGIVGHPDSRPGATALPDTTARIFCEGSVQAMFMETAHVEAGKSIVIERNARQCELIARDEIVVGKAGGKTGQIIGGRTQATLRVATGTLGASTGITTYVQVGIDPYLEKQIVDKEQELQKRCDEIDRVIKLQLFLKQNRKKGEGGIAEKAEATRRHLFDLIDTLTRELKAMRDKVELSENARVDVASEIFFGSEVRIAQQLWQAPDDMSGGAIRMQGSKIAVGR